MCIATDAGAGTGRGTGLAIYTSKEMDVGKNIDEGMDKGVFMIPVSQSSTAFVVTTTLWKSKMTQWGPAG